MQEFPKQVRKRQTGSGLDGGAMRGNRRTCKTVKGVGSGVFEIVDRYQKDAYRLVYAVQIGNNIYVLHAFQKKSKSGIATPKPDVELIQKRYKEAQEHEKHKR